jgi:hypothetical protein
MCLDVDDFGPGYVRTEKGLGFYGQGIAWDRSLEDALLWGTDRSRGISVTRIPGAKIMPDTTSGWHELVDNELQSLKGNTLAD